MHEMPDSAMLPASHGIWMMMTPQIGLRKLRNGSGSLLPGDCPQLSRELGKHLFAAGFPVWDLELAMLEAFGAGWPFVLDICDILATHVFWVLGKQILLVMPDHESWSRLHAVVYSYVALKCKPYGLDHHKLMGKYKPAMLCLHSSSCFVSAPDDVQVEWNSTKG